MEPLIEADRLYRYYGDLCAVQDLSFELHPGEVLGLLGPNGAGKSTTMGIISGCLAPGSGTVRLNGVDLQKQPQQAKQGLGYLPEHPPLYPELTVDEYLQFCARLHGIPPSGTATAIARAKERCGLGETGWRLIANLSKGYQQRVGIAQAVIHNPSVIILDEPTSGLDPNQIREIRGLIRELGEAHGVILSTHILPEVQMICNRVLILHQGRLVFSGQPDQLEQRGPPALLIDLEQPPILQELADLPGVTAVKPLEGNSFRLLLDKTASPGALSAQMVHNDWGLRELTPERHDLERIFTELTSGEAG